MACTPKFDLDSDPRVTGKYVRQASTESGTLTLVGVVHDHPASTHRVQQVIEDIDPAVLALELPPISIPLFEQYAETDRTPPAFGGEMSAAIRAAAAASTVGIDRPTGGFFARLARRLLRERPSLGTVRDVLSNAASTTRHAVRCRVAAAIARRGSIRLEVDAPVPHDISSAAAPDEQARDEQEQIERSRSFMNAFQDATPSRASQIEDAAREAEMAQRLSEHRSEGDTVAVVGIHHLDSLAERLDASKPAHQKSDAD